MTTTQSFSCFKEQGTFGDTCRGQSGVPVLGLRRGFCLTQAYEAPKFGLGGKIAIKRGALPSIHPLECEGERGVKVSGRGLGQSLMYEYCTRAYSSTRPECALS